MPLPFLKFFVSVDEKNGCRTSNNQIALNNRSTEDREYRPLEQIRDSWPKFVITRSDPIQHRSGIVHENVAELIGEGRTFGLAQPSTLTEVGYYATFFFVVLRAG